MHFWMMGVNLFGQLWVNWNCWVNVESMLGQSWVIGGSFVGSFKYLKNNVMVST
jgi:hypothetical protein